MPFRPIQPPRPGSIDLAAQRIYEMLGREERQRMGPAKPRHDSYR